jgi:catechol 2,3-dioxygenase-like lactoylglutathione lyase family enzyme
VIAAADAERTTAFYRAVLGAEVVELPYGRLAFAFGDQRLHVHVPGSTPDPRAARPGGPGSADVCLVWPGTVAEAQSHLAAHGVEVELGPVPRDGARGRGTSLYFRDPDGSLLELIVYG